jgi:hypothetical protein
MSNILKGAKATYRSQISLIRFYKEPRLCMPSAEEHSLRLEPVLTCNGIVVGFCRLALGGQVGGDRYYTLCLGNAVRLKGIS